MNQPSDNVGVLSTIRVTPADLAGRKLLTRAEAAAVMGISLKVLNKWIRERRIRVVRIERTVRIPMTAIDRFIERETGETGA